MVMKNLTKWIMPIVATILLGVLWMIMNPAPSFPEKHEIEFKTLMCQPDGITCGPTSVAMVLKRYDKDVLFSKVRNETKTDWFKYGRKPIGMTSPDMIVKAMGKFEVPVAIKSGSVPSLKYWVSTDRPVIILLRSGDLTWHYVVVTGYDNENFLIANPSTGSVDKIKKEHLVGAWNFSSDMSGNDKTTNCKFCKGTGKFTKIDTGPLTACPCCDGSGKEPDFVVGLLSIFDVKPKTMIVPKKSLKKTK